MRAVYLVYFIFFTALLSCREELLQPTFTASLILTIDSVSINTSDTGGSTASHTQLLPQQTDSIKITFRCQTNCDTVHSPVFSLSLSSGGDTFYTYTQNAVTYMTDNDYTLYAGTVNYTGELFQISLSFFNTSGFRYLRLKNIKIYKIESSSRIN